jgi:hypothetical protein
MNVPIVSPQEWQAAREALQEEWEDSPEGHPQTPAYQRWNHHDAYRS